MIRLCVGLLYRRVVGDRMDRKDNNMDDTCAWLRRMIQWIDRTARAPIHFAGQGATFGNRPAEFLELIYLTRGRINELAMGPVTTAITQGQFGILSVHFGNVAPPKPEFKGWCVFLDVAGVAEFEQLKQSPLAAVVSARDTRRVDAAFTQVVERCRATPWIRPYYQPARPTTISRADLLSQTLLKASLLELLGTLLHESQQQTAVDADGTIPASLAAAVALIHQRYHDSSLDRAQLAAAAAIQPDHFGRLFRRHFQTTPMRYLMAQRVKQACFLLQHTSQRIEQIAEQVGFVDAFHFSRVFKQHVGQSPSSYRSVMQERGT